MVQSLLLQRFLAEAIGRSPLQKCDHTKVKADVCQNLREALERHKLPDAVQDHYDYRHLQLPEALALYAFRLVAYGEAFLDDFLAVANSAGTRETAAEPLANGLGGQRFAPTVQGASDQRVSGYWNPAEPFTYPQEGRRPTEAAYVYGRPTGHLSEVAGNGRSDIRSSRLNAQHLSSAVPVQLYDQALQAVSSASPSELTSAMRLLGSPGRTFQDSWSSEKGRGRGLSVKKSLQNLVHRSSPSKPTTSHTGTNSRGPAIPATRTLEISRTATILDYNREPSRVEPMEAVPSSPRQARLSGRMSGIQWDGWVTWQPDEQHDS
jgi:hypothetical protein